MIWGDFRSQLTAESIPAYAIIVAKYAILGFGLYFYLKNKVSPLFWAIVAGISVALGWLAHFSPLSKLRSSFTARIKRRRWARCCVPACFAHAYANRHDDLCEISLGQRIKVTELNRPGALYGCSAARLRETFSVIRLELRLVDWQG